MDRTKIVAHRGITDRAPENTLDAFRRAIELGADAVELDVRLTADGVPVVYHYAYLQHLTTATGVLFGFPAEEIRKIRFANDPGGEAYIPTLAEVLSEIGGRTGLEIEIKGPEPEAPVRVGELLIQHRPLWDSIEVTSFEPALLLAVRETCPGLALDLLLPKSEDWMGLDVVAHYAAQRGRSAHARAVHVHPTQLAPQVVSAIRREGMEVHAWDVNDESTFAKTTELKIPVVCTDRFAFIAGLAGRKDIPRSG
jgi:glycerophosphoryl diester phosphodiesterase